MMFISLKNHCLIKLLASWSTKPIINAAKP
jgi:hypothetical protein